MRLPGASHRNKHNKKIGPESAQRIRKQQNKKNEKNAPGGNWKKQS